MTLVHIEHKNKICNEKATLKNVGLVRVSWEEIARQSNPSMFGGHGSLPNNNHAKVKKKKM